MEIKMSNNECMRHSEGLVDALELRDADLAQVQGARGSTHHSSFHHRSDDWWDRQNYWNDPYAWQYRQNYWWYTQPYPWFHREHERRDRR